MLIHSAFRSCLLIWPDRSSAGGIHPKDPQPRRTEGMSLAEFWPRWAVHPLIWSRRLLVPLLSALLRRVPRVNILTSTASVDGNQSRRQRDSLVNRVDRHLPITSKYHWRARVYPIFWRETYGADLCGAWCIERQAGFWALYDAA